MARHAPAAPLGKLAARTIDGIYLHKSTKTSRASCVGALAASGEVHGMVERVTLRAALGPSREWVFPDVQGVQLEVRGRRGGKVKQALQELLEIPEEHGAADIHTVDADDVPLGQLRSTPSGDLRSITSLGDDVPFGELVSRPRRGVEDPAGRAVGAGSTGDDIRDVAKRPRESNTNDDDVSIKRARERQDAEHGGEDSPDGDIWMHPAAPGGTHLSGLITRLIPMRSPEAESGEAQAAVRAEVLNIISKGTLDPAAVQDWRKVRVADPDARIGTARMILGCKNAELDTSLHKYKARLVFMGHNVQTAAGDKVFGAPDELYGTPVDLCTVRTILAVAMLRVWDVEAGDVEGAYLTAPLRGPATYVRLPRELWGSAGVPTDAAQEASDPCFKLEKAMYGLPRSGFDWFAHCDSMLTGELGWERLRGVDSVYTKRDAVLALYVDDCVLAGGPHARRREWAAAQPRITLRGKPEKLGRFLGVHFKMDVQSKFVRTVEMAQEEYARKLCGRYDEVAPYPAGPRVAPAPMRVAEDNDEGARAGECRSLVGALMYMSRATRPDITYATNVLARHVSHWSKADDKALEHLIGYIGATTGHKLRSIVDVRDRRSGLRLELWVDADHAGLPGRTSTSGWALVLKGDNGTT